MRDLIVLVADKNMEMVVRGLLARPEALGICPLQFDVIVHPRRDPGVRRNAADFLRSCLSSHRYALVMFDREGCGDEGKKVQELQDLVQKQLDQNGWKDRSAVIVLDPELEIWMFVESPQVVDILAEGDPALWNSVITKYGGGSGRKPKRPKEAVEKVLWEKRIPRSSALYQQLAEQASFEQCRDPAFQKFRTVLQQWFGKYKEYTTM